MRRSAVKYKTILFDADGTLLDFERSEKEALYDAMRMHDIEPSEEKRLIYCEINDSLWKMLERGEIEKQVLLYRRFELFLEAIGLERDGRKMADDYMNSLSTKGYLLDGADALCEYLSKRAKLYIVTNGVEFIQKGRWARCDTRKYFEDFFISGVIGAEKPNPEYFEYVSAHIEGFEKESTLIVGDSLTSDIRGGINYGIDTCWYNPTGKSAPADMNITCIATCFADVAEFITGEKYEL